MDAFEMTLLAFVIIGSALLLAGYILMRLSERNRLRNRQQVLPQAEAVTEGHPIAQANKNRASADTIQ